MVKRLAQLKIDEPQGTGGSLRALGAFCQKEKVYLYFTTPYTKDSFYVAESSDGFEFEKLKKETSILIGDNKKEDITKISHFNFWQYENELLLTYIRELLKKEIEKAWSKNEATFLFEGPMLGLVNSGQIIEDYQFDGKHTLLSTDKDIYLYTSKDLITWEKFPQPIISTQNNSFKSEIRDVSLVKVTEKGILLIYSSTNSGHFSMGVALLDLKDPTYVLWEGKSPLWNSPEEWVGKKVTSFGTILLENDIVGYFDIENEGFYASVLGLYKNSDGHTSKDVSLTLDRSLKNPLISPNEKNHWEAFNTFNPAAIFDDGKVHLLYRAQGFDYVSVLGYAASNDGVHFHTRNDTPAYTPSQPFEDPAYIHGGVFAGFYVSGGGFGGCEDPRMTKIDDRVYLTYVAFDGISPPRVALTSIDSRDFLTQRWLWERPVLISPPGVVDKSAVIFPRKINGKYVVMHRIYPDILIDFVDHLNFDGTYWLKGEHKISPRPDMWDSRKIGAGAPPIETPEGWLLIYQSVGEQDSGRYKIGAMLLDLDDPTKVLHRSNSPILEPEASYENEGFKAGVIYPCGAVVIENTLYVYYGGADSYVCVATANLNDFLSELKHSEIARLTTPVIEKIF